MLNILTLEDELEINDFYQILLKEFQYNVFGAATYEEAVNLARNNHIDLALIDHRLTLTKSAKDGLETIKELKEIQPNMKIIMVSANYPDGLEDTFKEHGIDILVKKPFHIDEMIYNIKYLFQDKVRKTTE